MTIAMPDEDAELIAAVRAGRTEAYATLYERHREAALALARELSRSSADADDVVADSFAWVLGVISRGGGPAESFHPYLLTTVRRVAYDRAHGQRTQVVRDQQVEPDSGEFPTHPVIAGLEPSLITRAFQSLPEPWRAVLWRTEVEHAKPAEVAALLDLTPNGVSALRHRAREGLRQAYLRMHLQELPREDCRPVAELLAAHVRGGLSQRDARLVDQHLAECEHCRAASAELADINAELRGVAPPAAVGGAATAGGISGLGAAGRAEAAANVRGRTPLRRRRRKVTAAAGVAVLLAVIIALAVTRTVNSGSVRRGPHPVAAASASAGLAPAASTRATRSGPSGAEPSRAAPARRPSAVPSPLTHPAPASPSAAQSASPSASPSASASRPAPSPTSSPAATPSPSPSPICLLTVPMRICLSL